MFREIIDGFGAYFSTLSFISTHRLHKYFIISGLISILLGVIIFSTSYVLSDDLGALMFKLYPFERWSDYVLRILNFTAGGLVFILGLILYKYLLLICIGPFMSPLSAKVEEIITGESIETGFSLKKTGYEFIRGIRISLRNVVRELGFTLILIILGLIPLLTIFVTPMIFLLQSYYAGFGNLDYYLERRANLKQSIHYVRKHRGMAIGNGAGFLLLLLIPVVGLFLAPVLSTVAATRSAIDAR
ncbi:MAG: EI24 domain-containing protein [Saprospiraceae bacterium]|nr:EI24 domain-containing protein [Saprospiraceae bacterium]